MVLPSVSIEKSKILVVEGKDEENFFEALLQYLNLTDIQVMGIGGKTQIKGNLKALVKSPNFTNVTSLGIVRDANDDPSAAFQSVCEALKDAELPVPHQPLIPAGSCPKVVIMIVPGPDRPGTLEDVCLEAVREDDAILCVEKYFQCLCNVGLNLPRHLSKAKVQVFLASRPETVTRLGIAAKKGYWPFDNNAFAEIKNFLQRI